MAKKKPSVAGKVDELFKEKKEESIDDLFDVNAAKGMINIPISRLVPNPNQPRKTFFEQTIKELAESIKEQGVLSPIIVMPRGNKYEIIAGERRYKAAIEAGLKEIPALIKKVSNGEAQIISLVENIQREDLNDVDRASALRELKANLKLTWEKIAGKLGLSKRRVFDLVGLLDLPEEIKEDIRNKKLTEKHGRALRKLLNNPKALRDVSIFVKEKKLTGDETIGLTKIIKSEPGFTIEKAYNELIELKIKNQKLKPKHSPVESAIIASRHLMNALEGVDYKKLKKTHQAEFKNSLIRIQQIIKELLEFIKNSP